MTERNRGDRRKGPVLAMLAGFALATLAGCGGESSPEEDGRQVYVRNCASCHNVDPTRAGVLGPEIAGSSRELIEARVMRAEYPPGYTPKRDTRQMAPLPHLKEWIPALTAYLNATP